MYLALLMAFAAGYALKSYFANEFLGNIERTRLPGLLWRERGVWHWEATHDEDDEAISDSQDRPRAVLSR